MSYASHANLVSLQLADSSVQGDGRFKWMLAISLVIHSVLLLGLMTVRFAPSIQHPLASYRVDLVTLPDPPVASSENSRITQKVAKAPPPEKARTATPVMPPSSPKAVEPIEAERVTPSIVDALENIAVPKSRDITPIVNAPTVTKSLAGPEKTNIETAEIVMPVVPQAPKLSPRKASPPLAVPAPSVPATSSLTETLKQAVQSVPVPQKSSQSKAQTSSLEKVSSLPVQSDAMDVASPKITTPGQAPQLTKIIPMQSSKKLDLKTPRQNRMSDSMKQVVQSVVVSEVQKTKVSPQIPTEAVAIPISPPQNTSQTPREKLQGMVMPSEAPNLAKLDVANARKSLPEKLLENPLENNQSNVLEPKIAKLIIPDVQVPEAHHILSKPTKSGVQNAITALQVSGSSPEGNAYWGRVWSKIDREWVAPPVEALSGKPLQVVVAFRIERNGNAKNLSIAHSSGNEYYDLAAKRAILDASPLPQFSSDMPESHYEIQFQFTVHVESQ